MTITFHCEYCNKKIEAKDSAGGKWGNCPSCHNKIYVPVNFSEDEELRLAPLDEEEQKRKQQLIEETFQLNQQILSEREVDDSVEKKEIKHITEEQLNENIISYLRNMADGDLDNAQAIVNQVKPYSQKVLGILDRIALSDIPEPGLEDIPHQVLAGLIRNVRSQIS